MTFKSINPATGREGRSYDGHDSAHVESTLQRAHDAFRSWRETPLADRTARLRAVADALRSRGSTYGALITEEMGKPIAEAESEIEKCAWVCAFYADAAEGFLTPEPRESDEGHRVVRFDPLGPVLAIMPWNFPFWQVFRFAAPALSAGNVGLLKHAPNVPGCALAIEELLHDAGFPEGCFQTLLVERDAVATILGDARVRAVTLTGSDAAGAAVAATAGKHLKKSVLELGGSDPFIVLDDVDLDDAADVAVKARMINGGQSCIAAKRFIVHEAVMDGFTERVVERVKALRVGDPKDRTTDIGPLARADLVEELDRQVRESVAAGAEVLCGGKPRKGDGFFYEPTAIAAPPDVPVAREETFGPVATLIRASDDEDALRIANASPYGLGGAVWTRDLARAGHIVEHLEVGCVFVNDFVKSDPRLPFGGVKRSGFGRELSREGIREFVNVKSVHMTGV